MRNYDDLQPDLQPVIDQLRANRPEATALELDAIKQRVRARSSQPARRRTTRRAQLMKSRLVILTMLVLGMLLSTAGAGLAVSGLSGHKNASIAVYGTPTPTATTTPPKTSPPGGGNVLGDQDSGTNVLPEDQTGGGGTSPSTTSPGKAAQPARQVEAGANTGASLPFTGFAAIPVLLGGIVLLSAGLVLRRRTGDER
jgi:hypothetical protein